MLRWLLGVLLLVSGQGYLFGQKDLNCLVELELPRFAVANAVPEGGSVKASVTIGEGGSPAAIEADAGGGDWRLAEEVRLHLREDATYDPRCVGKKVRLRFTFRVEGPETHYPFTKVFFRPPSHFVVVTQPVLPSIDFFGEPPSRTEAKGVEEETRKPKQ